MATVACPHCRKPIPAGSRVCHHCLKDPRAPVAPAAPPAPRRAPAPGARFVILLRVLYLAYGAQLVVRSVEWLQEASRTAGSAPWWIGASAMSVVTLALVVVALRRVRDDPFLWTVMLAGLLSAQLFANGPLPVLQGIDVVVALALWVMAFAAPGVARRLAGGDGAKFAADDHRVVAQVLVVFTGVMVMLWIALRATEDVAQLTGLSQAGMFYLGLLLVGLAAVFLDWPFAAVETLRFRVTPRDLGLALGAFAVNLVLMLWWWGLFEGRWFPQLHVPAWPRAHTLLVVALLPAVFEELLCRGVLWQAISQRTTALGTVLLTAALFAVLHAGAEPGTPAIPRQLVGGLVLGWLRLRTGSLVAPVVCHAAFNAALISWFG